MASRPHGSDDLYGQLYCQLPMGEEVRIYYDVEAINVENVESFFHR